MGIISIKNLIHQYSKRDEYGEKVGIISAVDNVTLDVKRGEFISILGKNGSGKSTLAKHINALLFPTQGKVYVCNYDTEQEEYILEIRKASGMVFQNPDNQIIATVVEEDVAFGPENIGIQAAEIRRRVDESLKAAGMYSYRKHSPNKLSGGQKQRVAIAGVLAMKPACIILDEPTAMLDPIGRREVLGIVHKLNREEGITVILVTHHMEEVIDSDKVYIMDKGQIVRQGTPREVFSDVEGIKALGLDVPQVTEVAYELSRKGVPMPEVLSVGEFAEAFARAVETGCADAFAKAAETGCTEAFARAAKSGCAELSNAAEVSEEFEAVEQAVREEAGTGSSDDKDCTGDNQNSQDRASDAELLTLQNVSYTYAPKTAFEQHALKDINLTVRKNEFIALIGHTGSGKSTLIQHFNGLEKPTSGKVLYEGKDIHSEDFDRKALRGKVGMAFQYPEHQLFEMSIYKDVAFGPTNQGLDKNQVDERVREALELVGVAPDRWKDSPFDLSGGQKKRVAIAGVLAMKPEVLILDEPTAGLDPEGRDEILGQIYSIYEKTGTTVILVSHSMEDVAQYAKRIIVMNDGRIEFDDTPVNVFRHQKELESMGLSVPQVTDLMNRLRKQGYDVSDEVINTSQCVSELERYLLCRGNSSR